MTRLIPHNDKSLSIQKVKIEKSKPIINDRETFIVDACKNKNVLHIGCIGTMIERISSSDKLSSPMSSAISSSSFCPSPLILNR